MARTRIDGHTQFGANYAFAPSGLYHDMMHVQAGELYIDGGEVTATGALPYTWDGDGMPHVMVTPVIDPVGRYYISASGYTSFVVTFSAAPVAQGTATHVANWLAVL